MQWILLAVLVAALLFLSRYFPKIAFSLLGALVVGAIAIVMSTTDMGDLTRSGVPPDSIKIESPVLTESYAGSYRFNGRFLNTHESRLVRETTLSITMLDCPASATPDNTDSCVTIGQQEKRINQEIPAGQARDVSASLSFDGAKPAGELRWEIKITLTRT